MPTTPLGNLWDSCGVKFVVRHTESAKQSLQALENRKKSRGTHQIWSYFYALIYSIKPIYGIGFTIPIRAYVQSPLIRIRGTYLRKLDKGTCNGLIMQPPFFIAILFWTAMYFHTILCVKIRSEVSPTPPSAACIQSRLYRRKPLTFKSSTINPSIPKLWDTCAIFKHRVCHTAAE